MKVIEVENENYDLLYNIVQNALIRCGTVAETAKLRAIRQALLNAKDNDNDSV